MNKSPKQPPVKDEFAEDFMSEIFRLNNERTTQPEHDDDYLVDNVPEEYGNLKSTNISNNVCHIDLKYDESAAFTEAWNHIIGTYGEHYVDKSKKGLQVFDMILANDDMLPFAKWSAITYLARFGKKNGFVRKDLLKALHYIIILMHVTKDK